MVIKRYIGELPVEFNELSSKTVSSERIQMAIDAVQRRAVVQNSEEPEELTENE